MPKNLGAYQALGIADSHELVPHIDDLFLSERQDDVIHAFR
jgi:hypothetical protein